LRRGKKGMKEKNQKRQPDICWAYTAYNPKNNGYPGEVKEEKERTRLGGSGKCVSKNPSQNPWKLYGKKIN